MNTLLWDCGTYKLYVIVKIVGEIQLGYTILTVMALLGGMGIETFPQTEYLK